MRFVTYHKTMHNVMFPWWFDNSPYDVFICKDIRKRADIELKLGRYFNHYRDMMLAAIRDEDEEMILRSFRLATASYLIQELPRGIPYPGDGWKYEYIFGEQLAKLQDAADENIDEGYAIDIVNSHPHIESLIRLRSRREP